MTTIVSPAGTLRIGALASKTGVTVEALRYYEKRGLLQPAARRSTGYREYTADTIRLVRFIKRAQALGFSLTEVEELVRLRERAWAGDAPRQLRVAAISKIEDIELRIRQLSALRDALAELVSACDAACPVDEPVLTDGCDSCEAPEQRTCSPLPCPLIEAFDAEGNDLGAGAEALGLSAAPKAVDQKNPPASRRRPGVRRRPSTREAPPLTQQRKQ
jgi:MerR family transcriptional regulator, copper efflux regulator